MIMSGRLLFPLLLPYVVLLPSCGAQLGLSNSEMREAVDRLSERFVNIRNEDLGIATLEEVFAGANYASETLEDAEIDRLLLDAGPQDIINSVLNLFEDVSSNLSSNESTIFPINCCDEAARSSLVCTYTNDDDMDTDTTSAIARTLENFNLTEGTEFMFGSIGGSIIRVPSAAPGNTCVPLDSRLQSWFVREVRKSKPVEVVILFDLVGTAFNTEIKNEVRAAASLVINSLITGDMIGAVGVDSISRTPSVIRPGNSVPRVIPVCGDSIREMDNFVFSFNPKTNDPGEINYESAFDTAFSLFSDSTSTDKRLLYFAIGETSGLKGHVTQVMSHRVNGVEIMVFFGGDDRLQDSPYSKIATRGEDGVFGPLSGPNYEPNSVAEFYLIPDISPSNRVTLGHANSGSVNSLTLSRILFNGTDILGVLYATIPFNQLLSKLLSATNRRPFTYVFMLDQNHQPLYHPLLPGNAIIDANIANLEPEGVIRGVLDSGRTSPVPVTKQHYLDTGVSGFNSFVYRAVPSYYHCRVVGLMESSFEICLVIAEEEQTLYSLNSSAIDIERLLNKSQSTPIYHNLLLSAKRNNLCNYFCKQSINSRISFQLTTPSLPTMSDSMSLVNKLTEYIEGRGPRPLFVQEGVAEEAILGMSVSNFWLDITDSSQYITRRHFATPNGLYLTYPPVQLVPEFRPTVTSWYRSSSAHPGLLTLTPPRIDPLREGSKLVVSVGYALRAPPSLGANPEDGGPPIAVVSADITHTSIRVFMRQALSLCEQTSFIECIIVDDSGNLVYERDLSNFDRGQARFFGRNLDKVRTIVSNLTSLINKSQCAELFDVNIKARRFHNLDTGMSGAIRSPSGHCGEYVVQHIPKTNTFLIVYEKTSCLDVLCTCTHQCINCQSFNPTYCECPCNCAENCQTLTDVPICPLTSTESPNYSPVSSELITFNNGDAEQYCFNEECKCRDDFDSCFGLRECYWCEKEQKCVQHSECCNQDLGKACCVSAETKARFRNFPDCLVFATQCYDNPNGFLSVTCPSRSSDSGSNTSAIVASIVGALLGLMLVVVIVLLFIYYQVCRKADPAEETSRESAFDFSNKTAIALGGQNSTGKRKGSKSNSDTDKEKESSLADEKEVTPPKEKDLSL